MSVPIDARSFDAQKTYLCQTLLMPVLFDARLSLLMAVPFDARPLLMD